MPEHKKSQNNLTYILIVAVVAMLILALAFLIVNISGKKQEAAQYPLKVVEIPNGTIDPSVWGKNFPYEYDTFIKTKIDYGKTIYGGSTPYSKLERYPAMKKLWAGYSFSIDHNEERGHHYAAIDQENTKRVKIVNQPGACVNCHAAEAPRLIKNLGWETFNRTPYNELKDKLKTGTSCADCHDAKTMELIITRPALKNALKKRGVDISKATRQEMRTYVCAQCHAEYYFLGENKLLTFPWSRGTTIEAIEEHYDSYSFHDWKHKETGTPLVKIQHPEFELWETSLHAKSGVTCSDCHLPYIRQGSVKVSDHWMRSPLKNLNQSCRTCHHLTEQELEDVVISIQDKTAELLRKSEEALIDAVEAIVEALRSGTTREKLESALKLHRSAHIRWDFISSENSTGFHSPQESARILAVAIDLARQAEFEAWKVRTK